MTTVQDTVWVGTSSGEIHAFSTSTYKKLFCYSMDPESDSPAPVQSFNFIKTSGRVVVALKNGRIFLCQSNMIPVSKVGGEGTFILTGIFYDPLNVSIMCFKNVYSKGGILCNF